VWWLRGKSQRFSSTLRGTRGRLASALERRSVTSPYDWLGSGTGLIARLGGRLAIVS
jgi:hypothetical protein